MASLDNLPASSIGILGTGDFARALALRITSTGLYVTIGSRQPDKRQYALEGLPAEKARLTTTDECCKHCDIIFVAMHPRHHVSIKTFDDMLRGKILIDVSNSEKGESESNAERLSSMFPSCHVVKAFNTVSAYSLANEKGVMLQVNVCGDEQISKNVVMQLATRLGLFAVNAGGLENAAELEKRNRQLFAGWGAPTIVVIVMTTIWMVLSLMRYFWWRNPPYTWERLPVNTVNKVMGCVSITCLAFCYIPGSLAAFTQLCWGTKHRRFNVFLDRWLKMRKQLGLYALLFGVIHMIMSVVMLSPAYYGKWYLTKSTTVPANSTDDVSVIASSRMNWVGEVCVLLGIFAIATMSLLGLTSMPAIARTLNWREWRCMQSYMGFVCLFLAVSHVTVKGASSWVNADSYKDYMPTVTFFSLPIPWFALFLRILVLLPCCHIKLRQIRSGDTDKMMVKSDQSATGLVKVRKSQGHANRAFVDDHLPIGDMGAPPTIPPPMSPQVLQV